MKINSSYTNECYDISSLIGRIPKEIEVKEKQTLKEMAIVVRKKVENNLGYSDVEEKAKKIKPKNYDGTRPYVHMKKDVKYSVNKSKSGELYAKIQGGKYTGYKWRFLNDGTVKNGKRHTKATHFMDKSLEEASNEIDDIIDNLIKDVI